MLHTACIYIVTQRETGSRALKEIKNSSNKYIQVTKKS